MIGQATRYGDGQLARGVRSRRPRDILAAHQVRRMRWLCQERDPYVDCCHEVCDTGATPASKFVLSPRKLSRGNIRDVIPTNQYAPSVSSV